LVSDQCTAANDNRTDRKHQLTKLKNESLEDRLAASKAAKQEMLAKFKARPASDSPEMLAKQAERARIAEERDRRTAERKEQKRIEAERLKREEQEAIAAAEQAAEAERIAKEEEDRAMVQQLLDYEAELKKKRDARYAARKARQR
jgi:hypothetical protein